jgi:hypothetical protein
MAHAYTPGLQCTERTWVRRERRLAVPGRVLVSAGQRVRATDLVAATDLPGPVTMVNVAAELNVAPEEVPRFMRKGEGEAVEAGEILAETRSLWGLFHSVCRAPVAGVVESISPVTGQVSLRGRPTPVQLRAYIDGVVAEVFPEEGVAVETACALLQGIFGLGGEAYGPLRLAVGGPEEVLTAEDLGEEHAGAVVVGGALVTAEALQKAIALGAAAVVAGGMEDQDVDRLLGRPLGVAITGQEQIGLTVIVTEGFGRIPMARRSFKLLAAREGRPASVNGATQIRAGVVRPEVIVAEPEAAVEKRAAAPARLDPGRLVRLIREPYFGLLGTVIDLPPEPQVIETEAKVRVVRVGLESGEEVIVPRANVELIEE